MSYYLPENYFDQPEPLFMNIFKISQNEYGFSGVLLPHTKYFYLVFDKEDEIRLPFAVEFQISDQVVNSYQYQLMTLLDKDAKEVDNVVVQMDQVELTKLYMVSLIPSFPFSIDISGNILLS